MSNVISPRILRAEADSLDCRPRHLTDRELEREEKILDTAEVLLARHGAYRITFANLCLALRLTRAALRFHFIDMDDLLGALLRRHLQELGEILAAATTPAARREAWRRATTLPDGTHTNAHTLLLRDRASLPEDLRAEIETEYRRLGALLSPEAPAEALALLATLDVSLSNITAMLSAAVAPARQAPTPPGARQAA